jgi:anti-sigma regulatory factor (Ser/Thr protein kinase)
LLCGYRSESVHGDEHADALREVCHLHTSVLPSATADESQQDAACREVCAHFSTERTAPRNARHFVTEALKRWGHAATVVDDAQLVVTELATNAVVHARSPFSVKLRSRDRGVHLEVDDANPVKPTLRVGEPPDMSCRGLQLVDAIAANWGVEPATHGKTVWAELAP